MATYPRKHLFVLFTNLGNMALVKNSTHASACLLHSAVLCTGRYALMMMMMIMMVVP